LFAWAPRRRPRWRPLRSPRTPTRRLRRGVASSFAIGSLRLVGQFALPIPPPSTTAFDRGSFGSHHRGAARRSQAWNRRWPLTSRAHRLGKPHRVDEPLTPSVTRCLREARDPLLASKMSPSSTPKHRARGLTASGSLEGAACLRRRREANQSAFHRIAPCLAAQAGSSGACC